MAGMPPWELMRWLQQPTDLLQSIPAAGQFTIAGDPNRVVLLIGLGQPTGSLSVALASSAAAPGGLNLNPGQPPLYLTLREAGALVTQAWTITNSTATPVAVYSAQVLVKEWPNDGELPPEAALWEAVGELTRSIRLLTDALGRM